MCCGTLAVTSPEVAGGRRGSSGGLNLVRAFSSQRRNSFDGEGESDEIAPKLARLLVAGDGEEEEEEEDEPKGSKGGFSD
jgi:hypothetical protein